MRIISDLFNEAFLGIVFFPDFFNINFVLNCYINGVPTKSLLLTKREKCVGILIGEVSVGQITIGRVIQAEILKIALKSSASVYFPVCLLEMKYQF